MSRLTKQQIASLITHHDPACRRCLPDRSFVSVLITISNQLHFNYSIQDFQTIITNFRPHIERGSQADFIMKTALMFARHCYDANFRDSRFKEMVVDFLFDIQNELSGSIHYNCNLLPH
jgi:hypothetical protein